MTIRDKENIRTLYYFHKYQQFSIAKLYGVSRVRIHRILHETNSTTFGVEDECILCGIENAKAYYIDGNEENNTPQNTINLCEYDKRRCQHMQLRRGKEILKPQF